MAGEKDYRILIVDRDEDSRERIASTLSMADLRSSIAEEKSVARAITHLLNADLNVLVLGPTLDIEEAKKLFDCRSNFGKRVAICFNASIADQLGCKNILNISFLPADGKDVIEAAFHGSKSVHKEEDEVYEQKISETMQLALLLTRLNDRLTRVANSLKKQHKDKHLKTGSLAEAINQIIQGASKIKQGSEEEDIQALIDSLFE